MSENPVPELFAPLPGSNAGIGGVRTINADPAHDQILRHETTPGNFLQNVVITDLGAGIHEVKINDRFQSDVPLPVPVLADDTDVIAATLNIPDVGDWLFSGLVELPIVGATVARVDILINGSIVGTHCGSSVPAGSLSVWACNLYSYAEGLNGASVIELQVHQVSGAPITPSRIALVGIKIGDPA
jgi:hypothetical protein